MIMRNDTGKAFIAVVLATVFGGALAVFGKIGLTVVPPFTFTFFRFFIGVIFLLPFIKKIKRLTPKKIFELGSISILSSANIFLFSFGIKLTGAAISQVIYSFNPVIVCILSVIFLRRKSSLSQNIGIILGLFGLFFLIFHQTNIRELFQGSSLGNMLIAMGAFSFSIYLIYSKKLQNHYSPQTLTAAFIGTTLIVSSVIAPFELRQGMQWISHIQLITVVSLLYVGIFGTGIHYFLYQYTVKHGGPVTASIIQYTMPPSTLIWAMVLLREKISVEFVFGTMLAYIDAWFVLKEGN